MKKAILWGFILVLTSTALMAQEEQAPGYSITFLTDKKDLNQVWATSAIFAGRSFSEIWTATIKMLIIDRNRILIADKISGFISCEKAVGGFDSQFFIEDTPGGVEVLFPSAGGVKGIQKISEKICKSIVEQLPPKAK